MSGLDGPRLTYGGADGQPVRKRRGPPALTLLLLVAAVVLAVVVVRLTLAGADRTAGPGTTPTAAVRTGGEPAPTPPASPTASPSATTGPSSLPVGDDAATSTAAPLGASETASRFVLAWLDRDPESRKKALGEVATTRLVNQLADTDPDKIPSAAPDATPTPVNVSEFAAEFEQSIEGGEVIRLTLVADPVAESGWLVDSVTPVS